MKNIKRKISTILILSVVFVVAMLSFSMVACKKTESYKVSYSVENAEYGIVDGSCASGESVEEGTTVTLSATDKEGYAFEGWYVQGILKSQDNPYSFEVTEEITIVAKFKELWHHHNFNGQISYSLEVEKIYRTAKCSCGQNQKTEITDYTLVEDSYSLKNALVRTGVKDRLIVLDNAWMFGYLEINNLDYFDENLTIIGKEGVVIDGMMINSGKGKENANALNDVMPSGITIKGIEFTDDLHIVNCSIDKLTISDCTFVDGAGINIRANSYDGLDEVNARPTAQINTISNTTIENCTFSLYANKENKTKIALFDINGAIIRNNNISGCDFNAIQLNNRSLDGVYGDIVIEGNKISDTYSRAIRFTNIKGDVTIKNNEFSYIDGSKGNNGEIIKANSTPETTIIIFEGNTLEGKPIAVDDKKVVWEKSVLDN